MVPDGWKIRSIEDIANVSSGGTPSRSNKSYWGGLIPWVTTAEVDFCEVVNSSEKITDLGLKNSSAKIYPADTILMAMYGEGKTRGKVAKLAIEASTNQACAAIQLHKDYCVDFYYQYLQSQYRKIRELSNSGSQKNLNAAIVKSIPVPIPPLSEQKKVAQILSTWDRAIINSEKMLSFSQQQKKALMQQLVSGNKRLHGFSEEWKFASFDELFQVANNKSTQIKNSDYLNKGSIPIVDQGKNLIAGYSNTLSPYKDVPVIIFGDHTRCLKWIDFQFSPGADGTQVIKTKEHVLIKFGYYILCNAKIPSLGYSRHMRELKEKEFKFPSDKQEQQRIASILTANDLEIESLQKKLYFLKEEKKLLMQELLTGKRRVKTGETE